MLQHVPFEGPGVIPDWGWERGLRVNRTRYYLEGESPPAESVDLAVVLGGPMGVDEETEHPWLRDEKRLLEELVEQGTPILGVCLGAQLLADVLGAEVRESPHPEIGWFPVSTTSGAASYPPTADWPDTLEVLQWHRDTFEVPEGGDLLAAGEGGLNQAFVLDERFVALQFHLELRPLDVERLLFNVPGGSLPADGERVQSPRRIREGARRADRLHGYLYDLLDGLLDRAGPDAGEGG